MLEREVECHGAAKRPAKQMHAPVFPWKNMANQGCCILSKQLHCQVARAAGRAAVPSVIEV